MNTGARISIDPDISRPSQRASVECPSQSSSPRGYGLCHTAVGTTVSGLRRRSLQSTCLDEVDFGVTEVTMGGTVASLLLRLSEAKEERKRWSSSKISGDLEASREKASSALAAKFADRQPTMSRIVLRAQYVKSEAAYRGARDVPVSKRIRQRGFE
jgi:hypothetical protein